MNILSIDYSLKTQSLDIYVAGCKPPHCQGCHNPESWEFNCGIAHADMLMGLITHKVIHFKSLIRNIMIFGGEPLDQNPKEFQLLLNSLKIFGLPIWVFTRYDIEDVSSEIKEVVDYIKTGRYISELKCDNNVQYGIELATSNQKIHKKGVDF